MGFLLLLLLSSFALADCPMPAPKILKAQDGGFTAEWRLRESPALHAPLRKGELASYQRWVRSKTSLDAKGLIENNIRVGRRLIKNISLRDPFREAIEKNEKNGRLVSSGRVGKIRPISCLESLAFRQLLAWKDLRTYAVEFMATILHRRGEVVMIADFYQHGYTGAHESAAARRAKARLRKEGWSREVNLHNHPFSFENEYGDIGGTLAPSTADVAMYQYARPFEARITNGLDTVVLREYSRFRP